MGDWPFGYNSSAAAAREGFKPSTDSTSLVIPSQKNFSVLGLGFSWGGVASGGVFAFLPGPGRPSNEPTFWPKCFCETRLSHESLEPLIGFLAYLDEKF